MIASFTLVLLLNILVRGASSCLFKPHSDIKARHQELEDQTVARTVARIEGHAHGFIHNMLNGISASRDAELQEKIDSLDDFYQDEILKRELLLLLLSLCCVDCCCCCRFFSCQSMAEVPTEVSTFSCVFWFVFIGDLVSLVS